MKAAAQQAGALTPRASVLACDPRGRSGIDRAPEARVGEPADDDLALAARAGDRAAFEALVARYRGRVTRFARALLRRPEDAEDLAQESFVRAFLCLAAYEPRGQFRSWLFGVMVNVCREHQRHERRRPESVAAGDGLEPSAPDTGDLHARASMNAAVRQAIARLPAIYRAPVVLHYLEELSVAETAAILGRSPSAVKVQLWRARAILARSLAGWLE
jgi:RNA polymerase sigma factor (sigma-70 family)